MTRPPSIGTRPCCLLSHSPSGAVAVHRIYFGTDAQPILASIRVPTLLLHRVGDLLEPIDASRFMAGLITGARLDRAGGRRSRVVRGGHRFHRRPDPGVHDGRASGARPRPGARDGALHRHRRLDRDGGAARRHRVEGAARHARRASEGRDRAASRGPTSTRPATACSRRSTDRHARSDARRRSSEAVQSLGVEIRVRLPHRRDRSSPGDDVSGHRGPHRGEGRRARRHLPRCWSPRPSRTSSAGCGPAFEDAGEHALKGVPDSWHLYRGGAR